MLAIGLSPMQSISPSSNRVTPLFDYATALRLCVDLIGAEFAHDDDALFHVQLHSVGADLARYAKPESVSQSGRRIHVGVWKDRFESILILLHHHADSFAILFLFSRRPAMKEFSQSESAACLNNTFARPNNLDVWLRPAGGIASPRGPSSRGYGGPAGKSVRANAVQASARNGPSGAATSVRSSIRWGAKVYPQRAGSIRRKSPRVGAPTATER